MNKKILVVISFTLILIFMGCTTTPEEPEWNNPVDPVLPPYTPPETYITSGPAELSEVGTHTVTFAFRGNENITEFSYKIDSQDWSPWQIDTVATLDYMDEGEHIFQVKGRYNVEEEDKSPDSRTFIVNAVKGPALMFFPRKIIVAINRTFTIDIFAEEVSNMMGVYIEIPLNGLPLELIGYQVYDDSGDFLLKNGGELLTLDDTNYDTLKINLALSTADPAGIEGTGKLVELEVRFNGSESIEMPFSPNCEMQDSEIQKIEINELVPAVIVKE